MGAFDVGAVGAGYMGLATGACPAHIGNRVTLVDVDADKAGLRRDEVPVIEPGLEESPGRSGDRLRFTTEPEPAARGADVVFIAVGTPQGDDGSADLSSVAAVARGIGRAMAGARLGRRGGCPLVVVNKSTVPVGGGDYVSGLIREGIDAAAGGGEFGVVSNPGLDLARAASLMGAPRLFVDGRNAVDPASGEAGLAYRDFGRG